MTELQRVKYVLGFAFDERETSLALMLKARPDWQRGQLNGRSADFCSQKYGRGDSYTARYVGFLCTAYDGQLLS